MSDTKSMIEIQKRALRFVFCGYQLPYKEQERPLGQRKTPPSNKLHNVTSRLMSNTTSKCIFTEYRSSIIQYMNDLDFDLSETYLYLFIKSRDGAQSSNI